MSDKDQCSVEVRYRKRVRKCSPLFQITATTHYILKVAMHASSHMQTGGPFLEGPEKFSHPNCTAKSQSSRLQSCFIHVFLIWTEFTFIQEVSDEYTSPFLDTDDLNGFTGLRSSGLSRNGS